MKQLQFLPYFLFALTLFACHQDSDNNFPVPVNPSINGEWTLINVSGGIAGTNDDFPSGTITWTFNTADAKVTVVNNNTDDSKQDILEDGIYPYTFEVNTAAPDLCATTISIGGMNLGCYNVTTHELTMGQVETDGYLLKLVR